MKVTAKRLVAVTFNVYGWERSCDIVFLLQESTFEYEVDDQLK